MIGVDCQPSSQMWRLLFFLLYHAYLAYAIYFHIMVAQKDQWDWCEGLGFLLIITALFYLGLSLHYVSQRIRRRRSKWLAKWWPLIQSFDRYYSRQKSRYCIYFLLLSSVAIFLALDTSADRRRLISAGGILLWVLVLALFSKHPSQIDWRQVKLYCLSAPPPFSILFHSPLTFRWHGDSPYNSFLPYSYSAGLEVETSLPAWVTKSTDFWPSPMKVQALSLATWSIRRFSTRIPWTTIVWPTMSAKRSMRRKACPVWSSLAVWVSFISSPSSSTFYFTWELFNGSLPGLDGSWVWP